MTVQPQCPAHDFRCDGRLSLRPDVDVFICSRCGRRWSAPEVAWLTARQATAVKEATP